jgi:hypothetical protein
MYFFGLRYRRARKARDVTGRIMGNEDRSLRAAVRQKSSVRTGNAW